MEVGEQVAILEKEKILLVAPENIPDELKQLKQWVIWKAEWNEERQVFEKIPYRSNGRYKADSTKPKSWGTFETIYEAYDNGIGEGIGFVLSDTDPYACIDIDGLESVEALPELAQEIVNTSYAELSPSGKGVHVWIRFTHNREKYKNKNTQLGYEIYSDKRFITFTGEALNDLPINKGAEIDSFIEKVFKREKVESRQPKQNENDTRKAMLSEAEIIKIAENSKTGARFKSFMYGGWEITYPSQSEADMAFCNDLAFWTNCDYYMMDSIFRQSSLMRDKWDREQNSTTYGDETLQKAIRECTNTFQLQKDEVQSLLENDETLIFPKNYLSKNGCLYKIIEKEVRGEVQEFEIFICRQTPIITQSFMNVEYPQLYHEVTWIDKRKVYKEVVTAGELAIKKELLKLSYKSLAVTDNNAKHLIEYFDRLNMVNQSDHGYLVERLGHIKNTFIHPLINNGIKIVPMDSGERQLLEAFQQSGTSAEWIEHVLKKIQAYPRALLMVLASFTSVILKDLKMQPFIVDFSGQTSRGKTTLLKACASVWGNDYLVNEWNLTKVAAERKASFLNSFPLLLDDSRKADERQLQAFVYNFSGGRSKGRGSVSGSQQEVTWNNALLSTGESALTEYAEKAGGVAARIISITGAPFGEADFRFFNELYNSIEKYYGVIGLEFLTMWQVEKDKIIPHFETYNEKYQSKAYGNEVISRIARYYAAIVLTGDLLNKYFNCAIDLTILSDLFDELNSENKAIDKPKQLLEQMLQDLDADRGSIYYEYEPNKSIKAIYKRGTLYLLPAYVKEVLKVEEKTIRSEWLRRGITISQTHRGKDVDYRQLKHKGRNFTCIALDSQIVEELGFDFSECAR
ncbi:DUF927 domain-containing protein [Lysinibacillus sp. LZ02]|uniref:phage NrS-1 polymerase family protein n=1 Tax=Lysinibacillus sp. LZ02 TaxID=3420668 RepID=UPI003D36CFD5